MITMDNEQLTRRLVLAEQEIARAHAEIEIVRQTCRRLGRQRVLTGIGAAAAGLVVVALASSASTQAQGGARPLTVKAPFTVVDSANKPIMIVGDAGTAAKPTAKDKDGKQKAAPFNRGIHVFNDKGDVVARFAVLDDSGYASVRQGGQGAGTGGNQASLLAMKDGLALVLFDANGNRVNLDSKDGLRLADSDGTIRAEVTPAKIWLGNKGGEGVVEAGTLPDGRGVVRTGPRNGGPLGPGTLNIPFAIMGHK